MKITIEFDTPEQAIAAINAITQPITLPVQPANTAEVAVEESEPKPKPGKKSTAKKAATKKAATKKADTEEPKPEPEPAKLSSELNEKQQTAVRKEIIRIMGQPKGGELLDKIFADHGIEDASGINAENGRSVLDAMKAV